MYGMLNRVANPVIALLLRSPLHRLLSGGVMLITVTGRRSGRRYTTPVQYVERGSVVYVVSRQERTWWRNLRGGAPVGAFLRGRRLEGVGDVLSGAARSEAVASFTGTWLARALQRPGAVLVRLRLPGSTSRG